MKRSERNVFVFLFLCRFNKVETTYFVTMFLKVGDKFPSSKGHSRESLRSTDLHKEWISEEAHFVFIFSLSHPCLFFFFQAFFRRDVSLQLPDRNWKHTQPKKSAERAVMSRESMTNHYINTLL